MEKISLSEKLNGRMSMELRLLRKHRNQVDVGKGNMWHDPGQNVNEHRMQGNRQSGWNLCI
jgi:hypothetical protein